MKEFEIGRFSESDPLEGDEYIKEGILIEEGVHRGITFNTEDLEMLAKSFDPENPVPLQLDHSESAKDTAGYLQDVYVKDGKLLGKFQIIDDTVKERIAKGLMKKLSLGFYSKKDQQGNVKPSRIREVSIVAFPQVQGATLFKQEQEEPAKEEKQEMSKENQELSQEMVIQFEEMTKMLAKQQEQIEKLSQDKLENQVVKFTEDKHIVPAQVEPLKELLSSMSSEQIEKFNEFMKHSAVVNFDEQGEFEGTDEKIEDGLSKEEEEANKFYEEHVKQFGKGL
ncbi:head maturation protease [Bacillus phage Curly]|uniref:Scaffold protein n=1 Tax=Bacillus phage Curly TaxID=2880541 RepID=M1IE43_9CAUD|nr:head maturation protease [Bacillus phage Curly]AGE60701.1 scaffold protein [Bacillus phage Curly]